MLRFLLHAMWPTTAGNVHNFLEPGLLMGNDRLRARFHACIADEAALKASWSVKGASGTRPCILCRNIVSRTDLSPSEPYL